MPLASFSAMCASLLRYVTNFKQRHPAAPGRTTINYEIVEISLSLTFLGTFLGIQLAKILGEIPRALLFCLTIAWATRTTAKKAVNLVKKENEEALKKKQEADSQ